jgi:hypothetical protein
MTKRLWAAGALVLWLTGALWPLQARAFFCFSFGGGMGSGPAGPAPVWFGAPPGPLPFAPPPPPSYAASPAPPGQGITTSAPARQQPATPRAVPSVWEGLQDQDTRDSGATF